jgi:hypothetical protein
MRFSLGLLTMCSNLKGAVTVHASYNIDIQHFQSRALGACRRMCPSVFLVTSVKADTNIDRDFCLPLRAPSDKPIRQVGKRRASVLNRRCDHPIMF